MIKLPIKATPIDFAYAVHTKIGNSAIGCTVNGSHATLQTILKNGDDKMRMKILEAEKVNGFSTNKIGKIMINNGEIHISNGIDSINCKVIQLENKRVMNAKELINGLKIYKNCYVY